MAVQQLNHFNVQTTDIEIIEVKFQEIDKMEKVLLVELAASTEA